MTEPQIGGTYEQILRAARLAEAEGLHSFARSDHLAWQRDPAPDATDAFATMGGLARDTDSVRLAVLVTPITFRHPAIIAKNATTIDQMSGGRFDLGVGTGWNDFEHEALGIPFPESAERWARLEDALGYLEVAFAEEGGTYSGRVLQPRSRGAAKTHRDTSHHRWEWPQTHAGASRSEGRRVQHLHMPGRRGARRSA